MLSLDLARGILPWMPCLPHRKHDTSLSFEQAMNRTAESDQRPLAAAPAALAFAATALADAPARQLALADFVSARVVRLREPRNPPVLEGSDVKDVARGTPQKACCIPDSRTLH